MAELTEMMNIGKEMAKKLTAVGIDSSEMLHLEIRYITQSDDRRAISKIYEESWKYAYQGIVPQDYLDSIPDGQWVSHIEQADRKNLVMVQNGVFIGRFWQIKNG